ncbi:Alpha/Beta hydrolase protein [Xylariaceae sp. FL0594]|nr:Alpha/Beta hydrolase protein [Xylariaceae sp. FL0594]
MAKKDNRGMLLVTMQPEEDLPLEVFHEWYNNEHGPTRLKLPHIFPNGLRYRAADGKEPAFMASYDVTDMSHLETDTYTRLRANRSKREARVISRVRVERHLLDLVLSSEKPNFTPIEQLSEEEADGLVLITSQLTPRATGEKGDTVEAEEEISKWYEQEYIPLLSKVPGWQRSRLFKTSTLERDKPAQFMALHDFSRENGLAAGELHAATSTARAQEIWEKYATLTSQREYSLFYIFAPGSRDLYNLGKAGQPQEVFEYDGTQTITSNDPWPNINSTITTPDGLRIPFRLEGSSEPGAPVVAFCNSLLTDLHMWDAFVRLLLQRRPKYRILRYDFRGRGKIPQPPKPSTLDILADDLAHLMKALRIEKLDTLIGVSMGGATALNFALRYPGRLGQFIACDFNASSSAANTAAWKERIQLFETPAAPPGEHAGNVRLAVQTTERWFHPATLERSDVVDTVKSMIVANDAEGFRYGCQALWDYDLRPRMPSCEVPGHFVVGEADGKGALVKAMQAFTPLLGPEGRADLAVVPLAGHLPMVEQPELFWKEVEKLL